MVVSFLRKYKPHECASNGVPLDWNSCTCCGGSGDLGAGDVNPPGAPEKITCPACGGYGSLKAAALHEKLIIKCPCCRGLGLLSDYDIGWASLVHSEAMAAKRHKCYSCMGSGQVGISDAQCEGCTRKEQVDLRVGMAGIRGLGPKFDIYNPIHVRPWDLTEQNLALFCDHCWEELIIGTMQP